jgi:hypothetical protein
VRSDGSDPTVTVRISDLSVPCDLDLTAGSETVMTHRRKASTAGSGGTGEQRRGGSGGP